MDRPTHRTVNPATGQVLHEYPLHAPAEVEARLAGAREGFARWRARPAEERAVVLSAVAALLRQRRAELAALMTAEMGKPIAAAEAEIDKCAGCCDHFAEHGPAMLAPEPAATDAARSYVRFDPLGPVLAIMPWNFPFWQLVRFAAPALVAGNVALLKHAPITTGCSLAIERLFADAGADAGVMTALVVSDADAEALIAHEAVAAVTLTGSERAGRAVGRAAGGVVKKVVLELGGSDPFIVLADAPMPDTARAAAAARCINAGQSCIAAKRFLVHRSIAADFTDAMAARMRELKVGDPADRATDLGPMARLDLLEGLDAQVRRSIDAGARLVTGGHRLDRPGFYYAPTVLADVRPGMAAFDEETFGPVAAVTSFDTLDEAIDLANRSRYGLGSSIWTRDVALAERLAPRLEAGNVFINGPVKSDPRLPFGGVKSSGHGRELARAGLMEFVNQKTVWIGE